MQETSHRTHATVAISPYKVAKIRTAIRIFFAPLPHHFCMPHGVTILCGGYGISHLEAVHIFLNDRHRVFPAQTLNAVGSP